MNMQQARKKNAMDRTCAFAATEVGNPGEPVSLPVRCHRLRPLADDQSDRSSRLVLPICRSATLVPSYMHGDPVADAEQVLQSVGDQHDRDAAALHAVDQRQHRLDLGDGQRGRRLVHDQDRGLNETARADRD